MPTESRFRLLMNVKKMKCLQLLCVTGLFLEGRGGRMSVMYLLYACLIFFWDSCLRKRNFLRASADLLLLLKYLAFLLSSLVISLVIQGRCDLDFLRDEFLNSVF